MKDCQEKHTDIEQAIRLGRAKYICPDCGEDVSLSVILMALHGEVVAKTQGKSDET